VPSKRGLAQFGNSLHDFKCRTVSTLISSIWELSMVRRVLWLGSILYMSLSGGAALRAQSVGFVYVASPGQPGNVSAYTIDVTTGALTPVPGSPFPAGLNSRSVAVDPTGHFAYVVNGGSGLDTSGSISAYTIDPETGALTQVPGSPFTVGGQPGSVAVDRTGQFAYVVGGGLGGDIPGSISAYTIDPETGALTQVPGSPFTLGGQPSSVAADPMGEFVYVAGGPGAGPRGGVSGYRIDKKSGALEPISGSPFLTEHFPFSITVDPTGNFVYVTCGARVIGIPDPTISAYTIDRKTGALTQVPGSPYNAGLPPLSVTVDPTGQFVYVANFLIGGISAYTIDKATGALTQLGGFTDSNGPRSVAVDPTGKFLYAADYYGSSVSAYTIDQTTGALTLLSGSAFPIGFEPLSMTTTAGPSECGPDQPIGQTGATPPGQRLVPGKRCGRWK
jgi:6-phosphogluconolactonase